MSCHGRMGVIRAPRRVAHGLLTYWGVKPFRFGIAIVGVLSSCGLAGCGDDEGPRPLGASPDAGHVRDAGDSELPPPPVFTPCPSGWSERFDDARGFAICEPWLGSSPVQWDCPDGWRRVLENGVATCDPFPESGPTDCGAYAAHFPGEPGCTPIGQPCPAADFPEDLPPDAHVVFARPGSPGDGTKARPYPSLQDIPFAELSPGTIIALARGEYTGRVEPLGDVTLWGACPEETVLTANQANTPRSVLWVFTPGARVTATNLSIRGGTGAAAIVDGNATLRLDRVVIEGSRQGAVFARDGGRLRLEGSIVRDTRGGDDAPTFGIGLAVQRGGAAEVRRVLFERNQYVAVYVARDDASLLLEDAVVRDTESQASDQRFGDGLVVRLGGRAEVRRALFERNRYTGVIVDGEGSRLTLEDAVIRDTRDQTSDNAGGRGLSVQGGASATVRRALLLRNRQTGIFAGDPDTYFHLEDIVVRDTQSQGSDQTFGTGMIAQDGAVGRIDRAVFEGNRMIGLSVQTGSELTGADLVIRHTNSQQSDGLFGRGLSVQQGSTARVQRAVFEGNREAGVLATGSSTRIDLEDALIRETLSVSADQNGGRGLGVQLGAEARVRRTRIERNLDSGASVIGGALSLIDVVIDTVRFPPCVEANPACVAAGSGVVSATPDSRITLERAHIFAARQCGIFVLDGAQLVGVDVLVGGSGAGACIVDPDFDPSRIGATFVGNRERIVFDNLPDAPSPARSISRLDE